MNFLVKKQIGGRGDMFHNSKKQMVNKRGRMGTQIQKKIFTPRLQLLNENFAELSGCGINKNWGKYATFLLQVCKFFSRFDKQK